MDTVGRRVITSCTYPSQRGVAIFPPPLRTPRCGLNHAAVAAEVTRLKSQRSEDFSQSLLTSAATKRGGNARRELEKKSGRKVVTSGNYFGAGAGGEKNDAGEG